MSTDPRQVLASLERGAHKRFGQHFLARPEIVERIVRAAGVQPGDRVIEVGPGLGILTEALLRAQASVTAIELDRDLLGHLAATVPDAKVIPGDATTVDWAEICSGPGTKLVANLPYNVGTVILMNVVRQPGLFSSATVMLQAEVVDRLVARAGDEAYGSLSVHLGARADARVVLNVPPSAFVPPPKVDSRVVRVDLFAAPDTGTAPADFFDRVVSAAFAQRRKMLRNTLGGAYGRDRAEAALEAAGIPSSERAERVDLAGFCALAAALYTSGGT